MVVEVTMGLQISAQKRGGTNMKLESLRENYYRATSKASEIARNTNYSLIAMCWIMCREKAENVPDYKRVLIFLLLSLSFDYLQYLFKSIIGGFIYHRREKVFTDKGKMINDQKDVDGYPYWMPYITWLFFALKFICAIVAIIIMLCKLWNIVS